MKTDIDQVYCLSSHWICETGKSTDESGALCQCFCCCCVFSFTIRLIVSCTNIFVVSAVHTQVYSFSCVAVQYYRVSSNFKYYYIYISTRPIHNLSENKAAGWSKNPGTACYRKRKDPTAFENRKRIQQSANKQTKPRPPHSRSNVCF